jgi:hypothetical protein
VNSRRDRHNSLRHRMVCKIFVHSNLAISLAAKSCGTGDHA